MKFLLVFFFFLFYSESLFLSVFLWSSMHMYVCDSAHVCLSVCVGICVSVRVVVLACVLVRMALSLSIHVCAELLLCWHAAVRLH